MICSTLDQLHWYKTISANFAKAIDFVLSTDLNSLDPGRYEIDGDRVFVIINEYATKPAEECDPEAHQVYADIQIMIAGSEKFGYVPLTGQPASVAYDAEKDVAFFSFPEGEINYLKLGPGQFIIFFPTDIHQPEVFVDQPAVVKKAVVKIAVQ